MFERVARTVTIVIICLLAFGVAGAAGIGVLSTLGTGLLAQSIGAAVAIVILMVWFTHPTVRRWLGDTTGEPSEMRQPRTGAQ